MFCLARSAEVFDDSLLDASSSIRRTPLAIGNLDAIEPLLKHYKVGDSSILDLGIEGLVYQAQWICCARGIMRYAEVYY